MTQNIPQTDLFTSNGGFGGFFCSYIRVVPWNTATIGPYACACAEGSLNNGYLAPGGGVAFTDTTAIAVTDGFCATTWRALSNLQQTAELGFKLYAAAGAATNDSLRTIGVCVRSQAGTFADTFKHEKQTDHTAYWLLFQNTLALGVTWQLVRVVAGAPTIIATQSIGTSSLAYVGSGKRMTLAVRNTAGSPILTAKFAEPDGSSEVTLFGGAITDTDPAKIAGAGRAGFGMTRDRQEAGGVKTATLATYFRVSDDTGPTEALRDEWIRNSRIGFESLSFGTTITDGNGITGARVQALWLSEHWSQWSFATARQPVDAANNRLKSLPSQNVAYMLKTYPPPCGLCMDETVTVVFNDSFGFSFYFYVMDPLPSPALRIWISAGAETLAFSYHFIEAGMWFQDSLSPTLPINFPGSNVFHATCTLAGTAPNRTQTFKLFLNGTQVPFHINSDTPHTGWSVVAPGNMIYSEAVTGQVWNSQGSGLYYGPGLQFGGGGSLPQDLIDDWIDSPGACCTQTTTLLPATFAYAAPPISTVLSNPSVTTLLPAAFAYSAPAISLVAAELARTPQGQVKFGGPVAGTVRYGGPTEGALTSGS